MAMPLNCQERPPDSTTSSGRRLSGILAAAVAALSVVAAVPPPTAQFASGVNAVEVYAAVTDHDGRPVTGLSRSDFTVLEDGRSQVLSTFTEGDFPLAVALAVDRSFSMAPRLAIARDAARRFLDRLRADDEAMIVAVGSEVEIVSPLSTSRQEQREAVERLDSWGTTGLHDAVIKAIDAIQSSRGRRALLLLSDGTDRYSTATASDAIDRARRSDVMIYPIALGRTRPALFAELATLTGGRSFQPKDARDANDTVEMIANELRHQYLLGYTPSRPIVPGEQQWRTITVRTRRTDVTVRARDGYLAR
jgi:Ca-activated chloride channel homolog